MRQTTAFTLCTLALMSSACVKKSDYEALQAQAASTEADLSGKLDAERQKTASLEQALADEEEKVEELEAKVAELEASIEEANAKHASVLNDKAKLAASIEEMKVALRALEQQRKRSDARVAEYKRLLARFQKLIDAGKLRVKIVNGRMVVELPSDILFASGSVDISKEGKEAIAETAKILAEMGNRKFQIEGHTDDQPIHTPRFPNNWVLAAGRSIAVLQVMVDAGMKRRNLSAASYADVVPAASNKTKKGRAQNRRIEIAMVPDFSVLPGFDELEKMAKR